MIHLCEKETNLHKSLYIYIYKPVNQTKLDHLNQTGKPNQTRPFKPCWFGLVSIFYESGLVSRNAKSFKTSSTLV